MAVIVNELELVVDRTDDSGPEPGQPPRPHTGRSQPSPQSPSPYDIEVVMRHHAAREERVRAH